MIKLTNIIKEGPLFKKLSITPNSLDEFREEIYMDDSKFVRKWWKEPVEKAEQMLDNLNKAAELNDKLLKGMGRNVVRSLYKKQKLWISFKVKFLTQIVTSKQGNPDFIPDDWK